MQVWRRDGRGRRSRGASKTRKRTKPLARRALIGRGRILGDSARAGFAESILMRGSDAIDGRARVLPSRDSIDRSKRRSRFPTPHRRLANPKSGRRDVERSSIDARRSADRSGRSERSHRFAALALTGKRSVRFFDASVCRVAKKPLSRQSVFGRSRSRHARSLRDEEVGAGGLG